MIGTYEDEGPRPRQFQGKTCSMTLYVSYTFLVGVKRSTQETLSKNVVRVRRRCILERMSAHPVERGRPHAQSCLKTQTGITVRG